MDKCIPIQFDANLVLQIQPALHIIIGVLLLIAFLLLLIICKWHRLIDYVMAFDLILHALANILPQDWYSRTDYSIFVSMNIFFMLWYT